jgi:hypothetical protein
LLSLFLSNDQGNEGRTEEENEAHTNVINKQMLLPPSPSRSEQVEENKTSLHFLSHLMLAFIPPSSL